jgi:hypothetical protein
VAHVELDLSDPYHAGDSGPVGSVVDGDALGTLDRWTAAVASSGEACLLLNSSAVVVAVSVGFTELFGVPWPDAIGRRFGDQVLQLLDFSGANGVLPDWEVGKIPPLLALSSGALARGLIRVSNVYGATSTVDAVTTPLREGGTVVGSLTFFALVHRAG